MGRAIMANLHTRLLAEVNRRSWLVADNEQAQMAEAVVAVVELHAPVPCGYSFFRTPETHRVCKMCGPGINADQCYTIRVIAEQLGVPIDKSITEKEERRG